MFHSRAWTLLLFVLLCGCRTATIYNVNHAAFDVPPNTTLANITPVIREAAEQLGWSIQEVRPGEMRGMRTRGRHTAIIEIFYTPTTFSIHYVDSTNLMGDGTKVHKIYNRWIEELEQTISRNVRFHLK